MTALSITMDMAQPAPSSCQTAIVGSDANIACVKSYAICGLLVLCLALNACGTSRGDGAADPGSRAAGTPAVAAAQNGRDGANSADMLDVKLSAQDGLRMSTTDGALSLNVGGRIVIDAAAFDEDSVDL